MAQPQSRWVRFKRFLKRNMTPTWAKHFSYQVFSFLVSVAMVIGWPIMPSLARMTKGS